MAIFNISDYRIGTGEALFNTQTMLPIRRPSLYMNLRVHPDAAFEFTTKIVQCKNGKSKGYYLVAPELHDCLTDHARTTRLVLATGTDANSAFLWPLKYSLPGTQNSWNASADDTAQKAQNSWGSLASDQQAEHYYFRPAANITQCPVWPRLNMETLVANAFRERIITSVDHPAVRGFLK